jgi:hypothetical protein
MTSKKKLKARILELVRIQDQQANHIANLQGTVMDLRIYLMASPEKQKEMLAFWHQSDGLLRETLELVESTMLFGHPGVKP